MKKTLYILLIFLIGLVSFGQVAPYGTVIRNNVQIIRSTDTIWIQQDASYAQFYATKDFKFNGDVYVTDSSFLQILSATGINAHGPIDQYHSGTNQNSYVFSQRADSGGTHQQATLGVIFGADPYWQFSVPNDAGLATPTINLHDTLLGFATDNAVNIGEIAAHRPKNIYAAGTVYGSVSPTGLTPDYVTKMGALALVNSIIRDDGTYVAIDTVPGVYKFRVAGTSHFSNDVTIAHDLAVLDTVFSATGYFTSRVSATDFIASDTVRGVTLFDGTAWLNSGALRGATDVIANDTIKGANGVFSARVTGTDFIATDSVYGATGYFTGDVFVGDVLNVTDSILTAFLTSGNAAFNGTITQNDPGTSVNSYLFTQRADNATTIQSATMQVIYGGDPYWRFSAPNDAGAPTPVFDMHDNVIAFTSDNVVDIGSSGANRPKDMYLAGDLWVAGTFHGITSITTYGDTLYAPYITLNNSQWIKSLNAVGDTSNIIQLNSSNLITFGQTVNLASLYCVADAGSVLLWNQPSVSLSYGDSLFGRLTIDNEDVFRVQGVSDGAGGLVDARTGVVERKPIRTVTDTTAVTNLDYAILCDATSGGIVVNLPTPASAYNKIYRVKAINVDNEVWVQCSSGSIDGTAGSTGVQLTTIYDAIELHSNGTNWYIW